MDAPNQTKLTHQIARQLASLKILSRLLAHELHAQQSSKQVSLSRDEVLEIQTCLDLYIEEVSRRQGQAGGALPSEPTLVAARNN